MDELVPLPTRFCSLQGCLGAKPPNCLEDLLSLLCVFASYYCTRILLRNASFASSLVHAAIDKACVGCLIVSCLTGSFPSILIWLLLGWHT
ncbi:hypothetical protein V8C44DRAFT_63803 [Trichoderma aethiopicum]